MGLVFVVAIVGVLISLFGVCAGAYAWYGGEFRPLFWSTFHLLKSESLDLESVLAVGEDIAETDVLLGTICEKNAPPARLIVCVFPEQAFGEFWCLIKASGLANLLVHLVQWNGFSPVCSFS